MVKLASQRSPKPSFQVQVLAPPLSPAEALFLKQKSAKAGFAPSARFQQARPANSYFAIPDKYKSFEFEKYLKSGSGRAFIKKHLA